MILRDYISEIRKQLPLDFPDVSDRMFTRLINQFRSIGIKNNFNENKAIDERLSQTISGLELKMSDQSDTFFISTDSRVLKTVNPIPDVVKLSHRDLILNVRNAKILSKPYSYITKDAAIYAGNGKYNKNDIFCFIYNDYMYVKLNANNPKIKLLTHLSIEAIFENPLQCIPFQYSGYFDELDYEYPMVDTMWGYIKSNILEHGFNIIQADINEKKV